MTFAALAMTFVACSGNKKSESQKNDTASNTEEVAVAEPTSETSEVLKSADGRLMVADFSAEWCPPCRQMKPVFQKLKTEYEGKVDLVTIDVDDNPRLAECYNVTSIPTLVYISPSGKELYRTVGFQTEAIIRADILRFMND